MFGVFVALPLLVVVLLIAGWLGVRFWPVVAIAAAGMFLWFLKDQPTEQIVWVAVFVALCALGVWALRRGLVAMERGIRRGMGSWDAKRAAVRARRAAEQWGIEEPPVRKPERRQPVGPGAHGRRWR
jgi:hypothetical protein